MTTYAKQLENELLIVIKQKNSSVKQEKLLTYLERVTSESHYGVVLERLNKIKQKRNCDHKKKVSRKVFLMPFDEGYVKDYIGKLSYDNNIYSTVTSTIQEIKKLVDFSESVTFIVIRNQNKVEIQVIQNQNYIKSVFLSTKTLAK